MARTTVNIDDIVLKDAKRLAGREVKSLGQMMSELLLLGLEQKAKPAQVSEKPRFPWISRDLGLKVDLDDKEAIQAMFDREDFPEFFK